MYKGFPTLRKCTTESVAKLCPEYLDANIWVFWFCSLFSLTWSAGCSQGITNPLHVWRVGQKDMAWHSVTIQGSETEDSKGQTHFYNGGGILYTNIWEQMGVEIFPPISWRS